MRFFKKQNALRNVSVFTLAVFALSGCYPTPPDVQITYDQPQLLAAEKFQGIVPEHSAEVADAEQAQKLAGDVLFRFLDIVGFTSHRIGQMGSGVPHFPTYAVTMPKTKLRLQSVSSTQCVDGQTNTESTSTVPPHSFAVVWDDVDDNQRASVDDMLHHVYNDCTDKYLQQNLDGVLTFHGNDFPAFFAGHDNEEQKDGTRVLTWTEMHVTVKLQATDVNGATALVNDALITMKRTESTNVLEISPVAGASKALFGLNDGDNRYLFLIDHARITYDLDEDIEKISFHGHYYDTLLGGAVAIDTVADNDIEFIDASRSFEAMMSSANMTGEHAKLHTGKFDITLKNDNPIRVATTNTANEVNIEFGGKTVKLTLDDIMAADMMLTLVALE